MRSGQMLEQACSLSNTLWILIQVRLLQGRLVLQAAVPFSTVEPAFFGRRQKRGDVTSAIYTQAFLSSRNQQSSPLHSGIANATSQRSRWVFHLKHIAFSFQTLPGPPESYASVLTKELQKHPTVQSPFHSPYSWENDGQTILVKLLMCLGSQTLSVQTSL